MLAMQQGFALPADFDMTAIRAKVAEKASDFETVPGLVCKAFLLNERGDRRPRMYNPGTYCILPYRALSMQGSRLGSTSAPIAAREIYFAGPWRILREDDTGVPKGQ